MSRLHAAVLDVLTWAFTRIWGHLLIPTLLGTVCWLLTVHWTGWIFIHWLAWVAAMLALGWLLTIASWAHFYWGLHVRDRVDPRE